MSCGLHVLKSLLDYYQILRDNAIEDNLEICEFCRCYRMLRSAGRHGKVGINRDCATLR